MSTRPPIIPAQAVGLARLRRRLLHCRECGGTCGGHNKPARAPAEGEGAPTRLAYGASAPVKHENGRVVSSKSKTGDPACSKAVSDWKRGGQGKGSAVALKLAECRAKARAQGKIAAFTNSGKLGAAQVLEKRIATGAPLTAKDRKAQAKAQAKALRAQRAARGSEPQATGGVSQTRNVAPTPAPAPAAVPPAAPANVAEHIAARRAALGATRPPLKVGTPVAVPGLGTRPYRIAAVGKGGKAVTVRPDELTPAQQDQQRGRYGAFDRAVSPGELFHPQHAQELATLGLAENAAKRGNEGLARRLLGIAPQGAQATTPAHPEAPATAAAPGRDPVLQDIGQLSSGTMATLTGHRDYATLDATRARFHDFAAARPGQFDTWHDAWHAFQAHETGAIPTAPAGPSLRAQVEAARAAKGMTRPEFRERAAASARDMRDQKRAGRAELAHWKQVESLPTVERIKALFDEKGHSLRGGDYLRKQLAGATEADLDALDAHVKAQPFSSPARINLGRWLGGEIAGERRRRENLAAQAPAPAPEPPPAAPTGEPASAPAVPSGGAAPRAPMPLGPAKPAPTLSAKGNKLDRLAELRNRLGGQIRHRQAQGQIKARDTIAARRHRIDQAIDAERANVGHGLEISFRGGPKGAPSSPSPGLPMEWGQERTRNDAPGQTSILDRVGSVDTRAGAQDAPFTLANRGKSATFANAGKGKTSALFEDMKGAAARDLPGQSTFLGSAGAAARPDHRLKGDREPLRAQTKLTRLSTLANRAQASHESLRDRGQTGKPYTDRLDRAINLKRRAQAEEDRGAPAAEPHDTMAGATLRQQAESSRLAKGLSGEGRAATAARLKRLRSQAAAAKTAPGAPPARAASGKLKSLRQQVREKSADPATHTNHAPGTVTPLNTDLIHFDPERFQYKLAHNSKTGSVGSLEGTKAWNPELAGIMQVWKDPHDRKTYVINGHNRLDRAKKLDVPRVNVQFIEAASAEDAKAKGALTNIAEGHGTPVDAANFIRARKLKGEELEAHGITMKGKLAREGVNLSKLSDPLFSRVLSGSLPEDKAAMIGGANLEAHHQHAVVKILDKAPKHRPISTGHLRELLDSAKEAASARTTTHDLFGASEEDTSLLLHKTKLQEAIKERLSREKKLFGTVAKSQNAKELARAGNQLNTAESGKVSDAAAQALDVFDRLKNRSGPVSRALNQAAERIHAGHPSKQVADEAYHHILAETQRVLAGGDAFAS